MHLMLWSSLLYVLLFHFLANWNIHAINSSYYMHMVIKYFRLIDLVLFLEIYILCKCRSQRPRGLRPRSAAARLLRLWVRIPPEAWMSVCRVVFVWYRSLRRADHSSRGVLPTVVRRCVWSRNLVNEEALAHWGAVAPKTNKQTNKHTYLAWIFFNIVEVNNRLFPCSGSIIYCRNVYELHN
jgi:hypothetical protein